MLQTGRGTSESQIDAKNEGPVVSPPPSPQVPNPRLSNPNPQVPSPNPKLSNPNSKTLIPKSLRGAFACTRRAFACTRHRCAQVIPQRRAQVNRVPLWQCCGLWRGSLPVEKGVCENAWELVALTLRVCVFSLQFLFSRKHREGLFRKTAANLHLLACICVLTRLYLHLYTCTCVFALANLHFYACTSIYLRGLPRARNAGKVW